MRALLAAMSLAVACDVSPRTVAEEADALVGDCSVEGLRAADDACVDALGRGADRLVDAMEIYAGALRTLERLTAERGEIRFDSGFAQGPVARGPVARWPARAPDGPTQWPSDDPYADYPEPDYPAAYYRDRDVEPRLEDLAPSYQSLADRRATAYDEMLRRRTGRTAALPRDRAYAGRDPLDDDARPSDPRWPTDRASEYSRSDPAVCESLEYQLRSSLEVSADRLDMRRIAAIVREIEASCAPHFPERTTGRREYR